MTNTLLDATGLLCPLPVLKARKRLQAMAAGGHLVVQADDPAAERDFTAFCEAAGHSLTITRVGDGVLQFDIRKGA